jgi:hypothetical protein
MAPANADAANEANHELLKSMHRGRANIAGITSHRQKARGPNMGHPSGGCNARLKSSVDRVCNTIGTDTDQRYLILKATRQISLAYRSIVARLGGVADTG